MTQEGITQIDIQQVLRQKAPSAARKIPGFIVRYPNCSSGGTERHPPPVSR